MLQVVSRGFSALVKVRTHLKPPPICGPTSFRNVRAPYTNMTTDTSKYKFNRKLYYLPEVYHKTLIYPCRFNASD